MNKRSGIQSLPTPKINLCLDLMITSRADTISWNSLSLRNIYIYIYIYHCFLIISMLATHGTNLPIIKEKASWKLLEFVYNFLSISSMLVNF